MCGQIKKILEKKFENKRIVFWYDKTGEFTQDYADIELDGVKKLEIGENEFALKYRILKAEPKQKFLLYKNAEKPADDENWLLDVLLANDEFQTETWALDLSDLGLGTEFGKITRAHSFFFKNKERKANLKKLLDKTETIGSMEKKMLSVIAKAENDLDSIVMNLIGEYAAGLSEAENFIKKSNLDKFLFDRMFEAYGYRSEQPSVRDFVFKAFKWCFDTGLNKDVKPADALSNGAKVFMTRWKNDGRFTADFEKISQEAADIFDIKHAVYDEDWKKLTGVDWFETVDERIVLALTEGLTKGTIQPKEIFDAVTERQTTKWYGRFEHLYQAVRFAALFARELNKNGSFEMRSVEDGIESYVKEWYKADQYYRKFLYHLKSSGQISGFEKLLENVENLYSDKYLTNLNDNWQQQINKLSCWKFDRVDRQRDFYKRYVANSKTKLAVVVSDALRYEIGEEVASRLRQADRFDAVSNYAVTGLPSYTQLGMASLLPHDKLEIAEKDATVLSDGLSTAGIENREKILKMKNPKTVAYKDRDIFNFSSEKLREIVKENDVIYIFHNRIDETGHNLSSEEQTVEACENAVEDLINLVKRVTNANITGVLITADHGFIYENRELVESEYLGIEPEGEQIAKKDRRFVIGRGLKEDKSFMKFDAQSLGLTGDLEFQFPKSVNRLRLQGAAARFAHGGVSLQEIVVPVIAVTKKRQSDIRQVEVDILVSTKIISTNQLVVTLYQKDVVSDKVRPITLNIGLYNKSGELLSETRELVFDSQSSETMDRERRITLALNKNIDNENNQTVCLKLSEPQKNTTCDKLYKSADYTVRKTFERDF